MRLTFLPTNQLALQVSAGHLREAEAEFAPHPRADVDRATASATYHRILSSGGLWATTIALGVNSGHETIPTGEFNATTFALMLETNANVTDRHTWLGRAEIVGKPAHDLHAHEYGSRVFPVGKLEGGTCATSRRGKGSCPVSAAPSRRGSYPVSSRTATAALNPASACFSGWGLPVTSCRCEQWIRRP